MDEVDPVTEAALAKLETVAVQLEPVTWLWQNRRPARDSSLDRDVDGDPVSVQVMLDGLYDGVLAQSQGAYLLAKEEPRQPMAIHVLMRALIVNTCYLAWVLWPDRHEGRRARAARIMREDAWNAVLYHTHAARVDPNNVGRHDRLRELSQEQLDDLSDAGHLYEKKVIDRVAREFASMLPKVGQLGLLYRQHSASAHGLQWAVTERAGTRRFVNGANEIVEFQQTFDLPEFVEQFETIVVFGKYLTVVWMPLIADSYAVVSDAPATSPPS